uniref:Rab-GAP TBC domain-containing protein n=1 Tax=Panagrolaimus sp. PS1159 TaxID=55785 RepID=A0AC35GWJ8_9BILA
MAKYKKGTSAKFVDSAIEDDEIDADVFGTNEDNLPVTTSIFNLNGKPFSAVHRQILPKYFVEPQELFDEFGFRLTSITIDPNCESELETSQHRMKWIAHIQFSHEKVDELKWSDVEPQKLKSDKLNQLLQTNGCPHSLRPFLWAKFSGGSKKQKNGACTFTKIHERSLRDSSASVDGQIEKDLLRTLPSNLCFAKDDAPGIASLRKVLKTVAFMYPELGYCQGMGVVATTLLL